MNILISRSLSNEQTTVNSNSKEIATILSDQLEDYQLSKHLILGDLLATTFEANTKLINETDEEIFLLQLNLWIDIQLN